VTEPSDKFARLVALVSALPPDRMAALLREVSRPRLGWAAPEGRNVCVPERDRAPHSEQFFHARARADALGLDGVSEFMRELVANDLREKGEG
jgi:hypothetical protein